MTTLKRKLTAVALGTLPTLSLAHPGHDHADASSMLVHVIFYGSFAAIAVWLAVKSLKKKSN